MKVRTGVTQRLPQAPQAPLPALAEFLAPFRVHFAQVNSATTLERYVTGLLNEHPNKNCDTMASVVPGTNQQRLHHLLKVVVGGQREGDEMKRSVYGRGGMVVGLALSLAAPLAEATCAPDAVRAGDLCMDKFEASVWRTDKHHLIREIRRGEATLQELKKAGAVQLGLAAGDLEAAGCPKTGAIVRSGVWGLKEAAYPAES